jgi:hypothetical protein
MKKKMLFVAALFAASATFGQFTSKNGHEVLPEEGDIALGFDAVPVLNFGLNMINIMNNTGQQAQHPGYVSGYSNIIVGKYFLASDMAVRGRLGINTMSMTNTMFYDNPTDIANGVASPGEVSDAMKTSSADWFIGAGVEMRRGHNRLQGYYGGELMLLFGNNKTNNTYGFEYSQVLEDDGFFFSNPNSRVMNSKSGYFGLGLRGFAGVEYFFAPKISVGAEFGWGLGMVNSGRGEVTTQSWGPATPTATANSVITETNQGSSSFKMSGFGVDNGMSFLAPSAALMMHFHF